MVEREQVMRMREEFKGLDQASDWKVKAYWTNGHHHNVVLWWNGEFACGQSAIAVARRIRREARKLRLRVDRWGGPNVTVTTRRDLTRLAELLKFCNGRSLAATAANNWGRW